MIYIIPVTAPCRNTQLLCVHNIYTNIYSLVLKKMSEEAQTEDVVGKYKKLLALARSSLEANQASLAKKDQQISELSLALEEERTINKRSAPREDELVDLPRSLVRRVDIDNILWVLVQYESGKDKWIRFASDSELEDFIQRIPGVPLTKPHRCLTSQESANIELEAKRKIDRIVEEFRRFKVRSEISRKQKDVVDERPTSGSVPSSSATSSPSPYISFDSETIDSNKWKTAYERMVRENEILRSRHDNDFRERYEACRRERDELQEKVNIYSRLSCSSDSGAGGGGAQTSLGVGNKSLEQMYVDLRDEYKEYRRRMTSLEKQRKADIEELRSAFGTSGRLVLSGSSTSASEYNRDGRGSAQEDCLDHPDDSTGRNGDTYSMRTHIRMTQPSRHPNEVSSKSTESKIQYIRQMVLQYLSCRDPIVRPHIESALVAIFRFKESEKAAIAKRTQEESQGTVSAFGSFFSPTST